MLLVAPSLPELPCSSETLRSRQHAWVMYSLFSVLFITWTSKQKSSAPQTQDFFKKNIPQPSSRSLYGAQT